MNNLQLIHLEQALGQIQDCIIRVKRDHEDKQYILMQLEFAAQNITSAVEEAEFTDDERLSPTDQFWEE